MTFFAYTALTLVVVYCYSRLLLRRLAIGVQGEEGKRAKTVEVAISSRLSALDIRSGR